MNQKYISPAAINAVEKLRVVGLCRLVAAVFCVLIFTAHGPSAQAAAAEGLNGRLIVGYQGWFGCPGDYADNTHWQHLFFGDKPDADDLAVELLPSVRDFAPEDLCETDLHERDGSQVYLYSSQNWHVVDRHFQWMARHGIDGAALQRFIAPVTQSPGMKERSDHMISIACSAAEKSGRVFFITYDVSGARPETVVSDIRRDWRHLTKDLGITDSPCYLREGGRPVLELWGFGLGDRPGSPDEVESFIHALKAGRDGLPAVTLIGGVPTNWRTLNGDSKNDPRWAQTYRSYDIISPWSVGRFRDDAGADAFLREHVLPDMAETRRLGIGYMPVIFPGFSWYNLQRGRGNMEQAVLNEIPRRCGKFLWRQVYNLLGADARMIYAAMFDELDEGTALMPVVAREDNLPEGAHMASLSQDGCSLPEDWYLRIIGKAGQFLRAGKVPPKSLDAVIKP